MIVTFNPSGTHIKNGLLKVRADLCIDDPASKTYSRYFLELPTEPVPLSCYDKNGISIVQTKYNIWWASVPKVWQITPVLCHFITVPEMVTLADLQDWVIKTFSPDMITTLDDILVRSDSIHLISPLMRNKFMERKAIETRDPVDLVSSVNALLSGKEVDLNGGGSIINVQPQTITVGSLATDRASSLGANLRVWINGTATSDGTGAIDTMELWSASNINSVVGGTLRNEGGNVFSSIDSEALGTVTAGAKRTFTGLSIDIVTGDYIGAYGEDGSWEYDGDSGGWYVATTFPVSSVTFTAGTFAPMSIYGTGTEAGVGIPIAMHHYKQLQGA